MVHRIPALCRAQPHIRFLNALTWAMTAVLPGPLGLSFATEIHTPSIEDGKISFTFETEPGQVSAVQGSSSLSSNWSSISHFHGEASQVQFSVSLLDGQQFFRVRQTPFRPLEIMPSSPVLPSGHVSLADAMTGVPYEIELSPDLSGLPPYELSFDGSPPDGMTLMATNHGTEAASVLLSTSGAALVPGQRRPFTITAVDAQNTTNSRSYDIRVVAPAPEVVLDTLVLKAGEPVNLDLNSAGGTEPLSWSLISGSLPEGLDLLPEGLLVGTPTADAAELNEDGRYTNVVQVTDSYTDRLTGAAAARRGTGELRIMVRLSYALNIRATREGGPSLWGTCITCHGPGFRPDLDSTSASAILNVTSGSGAECGTSRFYIVPGDASDSLIYEKVSARPPCGDRMPLGGPYLSERRIARLARWIRELTPADTD
jgi:hypothetical protein